MTSTNLPEEKMWLQEQLRKTLHVELQLRYKEFFESTLAIDLLQPGQKFYSVRKVSAAVLMYITRHKTAVLNIIANDPKILTELQAPFFGSCMAAEEDHSPTAVWEKMRMHLSNECADISSVMQMHCIFIHRIFDHLEKSNEEAGWVARLFPDALFANRGRLERENKKLTSSAQLGISNLPFFAQQLKKSSTMHLRAIDKYQPDECAEFVKSARKYNAPLVCGPSGHTGSLMLGAKLYGDLTPNELTEYALVSFAFLAAGGNHSFYEVMIIAQQVGVDVQLGSYRMNWPAFILQADWFKKLSKRFSEYLDVEPIINSTKGMSYA